MSAEALVLAALGAAETEEPHAWRDTAVRLAAEDAWRRGDLAAIRCLATSYDVLLLRVPRRENGAVALVDAGTGERRHRGAFGTPPALAASLAGRALPDPLRGGPIVDPACGAGALLRAALARLLDAGVAPAEAAARLHGVDNDPVAVALCRLVLAADLADAGFPCEPGDLAIAEGDALLMDLAAAFPAALAVTGAEADPVTGWRGGFAAVVANPPWERLKVHARDWAAPPPTGLRGARAATARAVRDGGRHPLTGVGELNAYLPFVETCWRLLGPSGRAAILVPAGIASDRSAARLVEQLTRTGSLAGLGLIEPVTPVFPGVSTRVGVAIVELRGGPARPADGAPARVAVGLDGPGPVPEGRSWPLDAGLLRLVNPNTGTAPLFGSAADAAIVTGVHRRLPVLLRRTGPAHAESDWGLRLITPLHMTRDAKHFRTAPGEGLLPLWEAKHAGLLDPHGGGRAAPRYWVPEEVVRARYGALCERGWLAGYRNVTTSTSPRTLVPAPLPVAAVGNSLPLLDAPRLPLLLAALASLPVDYVVRQKHAGANLNFFKLEQVPLPPPASYDAPAPRDAATTPAAWLLERMARAVAWVPGLGALAAELTGATAAPAPAGPGERAAALADIDAAHAVLLGLSRAELEHALGTFGALRRKEEAAHGRFVTAERVLAAFDALTG